MLCALRDGHLSVDTDVGGWGKVCRALACAPTPPDTNTHWWTVENKVPHCTSHLKEIVEINKRDCCNREGIIQHKVARLSIIIVRFTNGDVFLSQQPDNYLHWGCLPLDQMRCLVLHCWCLFASDWKDSTKLLIVTETKAHCQSIKH